MRYQFTLLLSDYELHWSLDPTKYIVLSEPAVPLTLDTDAQTLTANGSTLRFDDNGFLMIGGPGQFGGWTVSGNQIRLFWDPQIDGDDAYYGLTIESGNYTNYIAGSRAVVGTPFTYEGCGTISPAVGGKVIL